MIRNYKLISEVEVQICYSTLKVAMYKSVTNLLNSIIVCFFEE